MCGRSTRKMQAERGPCIQKESLLVSSSVGRAGDCGFERRNAIRYAYLILPCDTARTKINHRVTGSSPV